jgi:hypothetical protein
MEALEYERSSFTAPRHVVEEAKAVAGRGQYSAYVTNALRRQLERDRMQEILDDMEQANGPVDEAKVKEYMERLR